MLFCQDLPNLQPEVCMSAYIIHEAISAVQAQRHSSSSFRHSKPNHGWLVETAFYRFSSLCQCSYRQRRVFINVLLKFTYLDLMVGLQRLLICSCKLAGGWIQRPSSLCLRMDLLQAAAELQISVSFEDLFTAFGIPPAL